jgi:hypothetical protein
LASDWHAAKRLFKLNVSMPLTAFKGCNLMKYKLQSCILVLSAETIENICILVDEPDDLRSLTHVSCLFASIACPVYVARLGIRVTNTSRFVQIQGNSFRALAAWRRSRLFALTLELARSQIQALKTSFRHLSLGVHSPQYI